MSDDTRARQSAREQKIWAPFLHSFPFDEGQAVERVSLFGLYSYAYINGQQYVAETETIELTNLLNDYNIKIAGLATEESVAVADIVAKRYLANIDVLVHENKMVTKAAEINATDATMTAKIAALATDYAALDTLAEKVATEILKTSAKITELEVYIETEGYALSEVDVQIAEKAVESSKVDIEKLNAANEILRIQLETVQTAMRLIDIDVRLASTKVSIANTEREIAKIGLLPIQLTIEHARTLIDSAELPIASKRVLLALAKIKETDTELSFTNNTLMSQEEVDYQNKLDLENIRQIIRENGLTKDLEAKEVEINNRIALSQLEVALAKIDQTNQALIDAERVRLLESKPPLVWLRVLAAIDAAEKLAAANVTTTLTHFIEKAPAGV